MPEIEEFYIEGDYITDKMMDAYREAMRKWVEQQIIIAKIDNGQE